MTSSSASRRRFTSGARDAMARFPRDHLRKLKTAGWVVAEPRSRVGPPSPPLFIVPPASASEPLMGRDTARSVRLGDEDDKRSRNTTKEHDTASHHAQRVECLLAASRQQPQPPNLIHYRITRHLPSICQPAAVSLRRRQIKADTIPESH